MEQSSTHLQGLLQGSENAAGSTAAAYTSCNSECGISVPPLNHSQDITSDWLTGALRVWEPALSEVVNFKVSPFAETDHDYTVRLELCYANSRNDASSRRDAKWGPTTLLCKISRPVSTPQRSELVVDLCRREIAAYAELKYHDVCRMPTLLFSAMDTCRYTLLLREDNGALPVSQYAPNPHAQIDAVLRELALLHGSFSRHSPVSAPKWLLRPRDVAESIGDRYRDGIRALQLSDCGSLLAAEHWQMIMEFADKIVAWHKYERHILTITHGDMRSDKMFYQGEGPTCRATLVGWKLAGLRNPMFDVASLLSNSLTVKDRRDNEMGWLERYRRQFEQSGTSYAAVDARDDYRFNLFAPLTFNVCAAALRNESADENNPLLNIIARNCQAIIDWNALNFPGLQLGAA